MNSIYFAQLVFLIAAGALSRPIAAAVGGTSLTAWPTAILAISAVALSPPVAQAADFWGRKWPLVILTTFGVIGPIIIARANSFGVVLAGFAVGGIAYGAQPLLHAVVSEVLPRKYRSWAQSSVNVSVGFGAIFGLLVGGALAEGSLRGYRTYLYINAGLFGAAALAVLLLYNPPPRETQVASTRAKLRQLDWAGFGLITSGLSLFCLGLSWSQNPYSWDNAHVLAPFLIGIGIIVALVVYAWKINPTGLFHHDLFRHRNFPLSLVCIFIEGAGALGANYFVPFHLSVLFPTMSTFRVTLCYSVSYICFVIFSFSVGAYIWKTKTVRAPSMAGFLGFLLFFILAATAKTSTSQANFWGYMVFLGAGLAFLLTTLMVSAQLATPAELIAITSGLMLCVRSLGASTGLAVFNAIFNHGITQNMAPKVAAATIPLGLDPESLGPFLGALTSHDQNALMQIPGVTPDIIAAGGHAVQEAYQVAFSYVWATAASFSFVAMIGKPSTESCVIIYPLADRWNHLQPPSFSVIPKKNSTPRSMLRSTWWFQCRTLKPPQNQRKRLLESR